MKKGYMKKRSKLDQAEGVAFDYYENLTTVLRDLEHIDQLIPAESSRIMLGDMDGESKAIIQGRKTALLRYIQVICRDHIYWGKKLLDGGWTVEQHNRNKRKRARK